MKWFKKNKKKTEEQIALEEFEKGNILLPENLTDYEDIGMLERELFDNKEVQEKIVEIKVRNDMEKNNHGK